MKMPKLILICGGSCSGKTTLGNLLANCMENTLLLSMDNYFINYSSYAEEELANINFDIPEAFHTDLLIKNLNDIIKHRHTELPIYDFKNHKIGNWRTYADTPQYIIVEGIMTFCSEELLRMSSLKIFVETPMDIMLWRRVSRDSSFGFRLLSMS